MKKLFVMLALAGGTMGTFAQTETDSAAVVNKGITPVKEVYPQKRGRRGPLSRTDPKTHFRPDDTAVRSGSDLRQDHAYHLPVFGALCGPRIAEPHCRQGGRCGKMSSV